MPHLHTLLPALYSHLLPDSILTLDAPEEKKATCSDCAMCSTDATTRVDPADGCSRLFRPDTKCCTYQPKLPNYLVGAILADDTPGMAEGRARIRDRVQSGVGVSPLGLNPPATYSLLYANARGFFGRAASMRCGFYRPDGGLCTIWKYREAVCSTWYCKYDAGEDGRKFWGSVKKVLSLSEIQLSRYAALELLPDFILQERDRATAAAAPSLHELEGEPESEDSRFEDWGLWLGREEEYYLRCQELVRDLAPARVRELLGLDGEIWNAILHDHHRRLHETRLPPRVRFNPQTTVQRLPDATVALGSYSEYEALAVPKAAYELLLELDPALTLAENRARWRAERRMDLADEMLLTLYRHRVLAEASAPGPAVPAPSPARRKAVIPLASGAPPA